LKLNTGISYSTDTAHLDLMKGRWFVINMFQNREKNRWLEKEIAM
jgi:hypothetical protein